MNLNSQDVNWDKYRAGCFKIHQNITRATVASDIWEVLKYHEPVFISNTPKTCYFLFMLQGEEISHNMQYTYSYLVSSNRLAFQLHHAVHNMSKTPLGLFWQFRPSTSNYNDTLYYNLIQDLTIRHKTSDRAERQFTQLLLSDGG